MMVYILGFCGCHDLKYFSIKADAFLFCQKKINLWVFWIIIEFIVFLFTNILALVYNKICYEATYCCKSQFPLETHSWFFSSVNDVS